MKGINKNGLGAQEYRLVQAVWPGIVEEDTYEKVQRLMAANGRSNHNGSRPVRHTYALGKLLTCGRCQGPMENRSGTGKQRVTYYYYVCRDKSCGMRVAAEEIEGAVLDRMGVLAQERSLLEQLMAKTNAKLQRQAPELRKQKAALEKSLEEVNRTADRLLTGWAST